MSATSDNRPTRFEVDLGAIVENYRTLRRHAEPATLWPVVKANAYGHGLENVARRLVDEAVPGLCVATFSEGLAIRTFDRQTPVLVLGGAYEGDRTRARTENLICAVRDRDDLVAWSHVPDRRIALKLDCGMHRLGLAPSDLDQIAKHIRSDQVALVLTHLPSNEVHGHDERTKAQLATFDLFIRELRSRGVIEETTPCSAQNSAGCLRTTFARYDIVRAGLALYGMDPRPDEDALTGAGRLVTQIASLRDIGPGERVGYEGTFTATRPTRVATLPIGYGDGYLRATSNRAQVLVRGQRAQLIGRVSMDLVTVDVTHIPSARIGDEVVLLGRQARGYISADELARWAHTISYEVTTQISARVPRTYTDHA